MEKNMMYTLIMAGCYLVLFAVGELLYHVFKVKVEFTRKLVHAGTGLLALLFPFLLHNHWWVFLLCASFGLLLLCSRHFGLLPSINAIDRKSVGSLAYPVAVYGSFLAYSYHGEQLIYYYLPILILAISDPLAALSGKRWPFIPYRIMGATKTVTGSIVFFVSALLVVFVIWRFVHPDQMQRGSLLALIYIAFLATVAEALSRDGYDNGTIPLAVIVGLYTI